MKLSPRKANILSNGFFLITLGVLLYLNAWWPGILIALWILFASRQILTGRAVDFFITTVTFICIFAIYFFNINSMTLMPTLLVMAGAYIILKEFYYNQEPKTNASESNDRKHSDSCRTDNNR